MNINYRWEQLKTLGLSQRTEYFVAHNRPDVKVLLYDICYSEDDEWDVIINEIRNKLQ